MVNIRLLTCQNHPQHPLSVFGGQLIDKNTVILASQPDPHIPFLANNPDNQIPDHRNNNDYLNYSCINIIWRKPIDQSKFKASCSEAGKFTCSNWVLKYVTLLAQVVLGGAYVGPI